MMRKGLFFILSVLAFAAPLRGTDNPLERIFVSTDREVYISGDMVLCSLFSLDPKGNLSSWSAVSYLELISSEGTVAQAKVGLLAGRGAGSLRIPATVPTGVYRLVAYTSFSANEDGTPWMAGSRVLTIFNTLSAARVKDGVEVIDEKEYGSLQRELYGSSGDLELNSSAQFRKGTDVSVLLKNNGTAADFSFSVYHEDDVVPASQDNSMASFLDYLPRSAEARIVGDRPLEYDGEIISARVSGRVAEKSDYSVATLSSAGAPSNLYIGVTDNDRVRFMTNNIYGDREIVCEVSDLEKEDGFINIEDPFIYPSSGALPKLKISKSLYGDLTARKAASRAFNSARLDTLSTLLRHREDLFLENVPKRRYHLDDYNRFPSVREILVEFIPELRLHREKGRLIIQVSVTDGSQLYNAKVGNMLVMMDGVVLSDLDNLLSFDAMLLEDVDIYQQAVVCGRVSFSGVVNFITKKNYVKALSFPSNVRVVDFMGVSYPVAYYGNPPVGVGDDLRQVLYWDPVLRVEAGGQKRLTFRTPGYAGQFRAVADGIAADGTPIHHEWTFKVE